MWLVGLGAEQSDIGRGLTGVAGDIAKGRYWFLAVCSDHGVEVTFQRMESSDQDVDVVDTNTHLVEA